MLPEPGKPGDPDASWGPDALAEHIRILEDIATGSPFQENLDRIIRWTELRLPGGRGVLMLPDGRGPNLRPGPASSLPAEVQQAWAALAIDPRSAPCGAAALECRSVLAEDIAADPRWESLGRRLAPHGLRACWSHPLVDTRRRVLGTFDWYPSRPGLPDADATRVLATAVRLATIALVRHRDTAGLRASEARYRRLVESNMIGVIIADTAGRVLEANDRFLEMIGYTRADLESGNLDWARITPPGWEAVDRQAIEELRSRGVTAPFEKEYLRKDGSRVPFRALVAALEGQENLGICLIEDLSGQKRAEAERRRAEEDLQQSEERYRLAVQGSAAGIWDWDFRTGRLTCSPRVYEILGYQEQDFPGTLSALQSRVHPEDLPAAPVLAACLERGQADPIEFRFRTGSGEYRWLEIRGRAFGEEGMAPTRVAGSLADIHDRKQAETALLEANEILERTGEIAHVAGWELTLPDMRFRLSEGVYRILEADPDAPFSFDEAMAFLSPGDRAEAVAALQAAATAGTPYRTEVPLLTRKGRPIWLAAMVRAVMENGKPMRLFGAVQDITVRKNAELALQKLNAELEQRVAERTAELDAKNRELETFAYSVSHDLKAPLRGIDGYSRLLQQEYSHRLQGDGLTYLANIRAGVAQTHHLIDDILAYSRMERRSLDLATLEPGPAVEEARRQFQSQAGSASITLDLAPGKIRADREGLAMVLRNLMDNALKFSRTRETPAVRITSRRIGNRYLLSVEDNGIGFDMRHHDRIFQIFQRLHRAEEFPGTGVGLALVRKAMERMGGRAWAESHPGQGARFHLEFQGEPDGGVTSVVNNTDTRMTN